MSDPSPICEIKDGAAAYVASAGGVSVAPGNTVTIRLVSQADVDAWSILCATTDDTSDAATVTAALTIDATAKTATFSAPVPGKAYRFRSRVNAGIDRNGVARSTYSTTFCVYTLLNGRRVVAADETTEGSTAFGWSKWHNDVIRSMPSGVASGAWGGSVPTGTGFRHVTGGVEDAASTKVDLGAAADVTVPGSNGDQLVRSGGVVTGMRRPIVYDDNPASNYSNVKINAADVAPIDNTKIGIVNLAHDDDSLNCDGVTGNYAVCVGGNMPSITADYAGGGGYRPNAHGMAAWAFGYSSFADGEGCFAGGRSNVAGYMGSMIGGPNLTFAEVGATGDTITRSAGSWVTDEFFPGCYISVTGSASNNITDALVTTVTATVLTLDTTDLVAEGPVGGCAVTFRSKYATAFGRQVQARAPGSFGAGYLNTIQTAAWYATLFGYNSSISAAGIYAFTAGNQCQGNANGAVAIGTTCIVSNSYGVALGYGNTAGGEGSVALGRAITITGAADFGWGIGYNSSISARGAGALGENHTVSGARAFAHGYNVTSSRVAEYAHGAFTSGDGPAGVFRRNLLLGTSTNGVAVNVLDQGGAEFALVNARSYLVRVFVLGSRTDVGGRGATVHTLLVHTTGSTVTIDNDTTDYTQLGAWTVVISAPAGLTLRVACTGSAGETVKFAARIEMTELEGV